MEREINYLETVLYNNFSKCKKLAKIIKKSPVSEASVFMMQQHTLISQLHVSAKYQDFYKYKKGSKNVKIA